MKTYWYIGTFVVLVLVALAARFDGGVLTAPGPQACTQEAKLCPDGSYVGRTGPNCEFAQCLAVATTTSGGGGGILPYTSGVRGIVTLGPTCPVMQNPPDPKCADRPYETSISVYRAGSRSVFTIGKSDAGGAFTFSLPPGDYTITAEGGMTLPRCSPTDVSVGPSGYIAVLISCDTGIR